MKKILWSTCLTVLLCGTALAGSPQDKKDEAKPPAGPAMTAQEKVAFAKQVDLFAQVAAAGQTQKDPLVVLSAVRMLDQLPFHGVDKADATDKNTYDREGLLKLAKEYAAGDADLLAVIAKVQDAPEATAVRGHHDRPGHYYDRPYHERRYRCDWYRECHRGRCDWVCIERWHDR